tara:strand:+ start:1965 stop:2663 length:699 start_codon:yes stop_codon:yes gene_type:complete
MYRLIVMLGLLSILIFMGLISSLTYTETSYDLKSNNIEYTSKGFIDNKEIIKSLMSEKQFQNLIKDNEFVKVESKLKKIKSIENIDIYYNDKNELGIKLIDRTPIAYLKDSNSFIDINGNVFKKEQPKNYSIPSINGKINEQQILKILNVIMAFKKDKFFENKLKEIWFKNNHLYVRIKNLELDVNLGNQNKINDKLKMLKGFYAYKSKKINHKNYKQIDLVYNNHLVAIKK